MRTEVELRREIGSRILKAMKASDKYRTRAALADALKTSHSTIYRVISGHADPGVVLLVRIAQLYQIELNQLIPIDDLMIPTEKDLLIRELRMREIRIRNALKVLGGSAA